MTQTLIPPTGARSARPPATRPPATRPPATRAPSTRPVVSLHGSEDGMPMTWHVTLLGEERYLIERAEGDIHSPAVWMQARREAFVVGEDQVLELVRTVMAA